MARIWKIVIFAVLILLAGGALLAGAGLLTGASVDRVWDGLDLQARLDTALAALENIRRQLP